MNHVKEAHVPILSASLGITRYRVADDIPDALWREVPKRLQDNAFKDIDATTDERSFGWCNIDNMLDMVWADSPPEKGHYMCFSLRLDTRRIPPAVFKKHCLMALSQELAVAKAEGKAFISKDRRREIKDQVMLRLRARSLPVPAVFDAVWNTQTGRVLFCSTNSKAKELFEAQFEETFGLELEALTPFALGLDMLGEGAASRLENLEPTSFI
jgi:DNA recombination-dependent growth factor C